MKDILNHCIFLSTIILLTFFAYSNVLYGDPQFDDEHYIFEDPLLRSPHAFRDLNIWEAFISGVRPVTAFTFSLNYYLWGRDTFSYHITNLLIHLINGALVYILIYMTLRTLEVRGKWIAFFTALLFSIHPIQTESVSYMVQRGESLSSMFYLISMIAFIVGGRRQEAGGIYLQPLSSIVFIAGFFLALGSKEVAVTLPVIAFLYGLYFLDRKGLWKRLAVPGTLILAGLIISIFKLTTLGEHTSAGYHLREFTAWEYLFTQFSVMVGYLRLLVLPIGQSIDHVYPISRAFWEGGTIASFALLSSVLLLAFILRRRWREGSFFILWFFVTLLPTSSILPLKDVFVEHRLYLPSVGIFFIFASGMVRMAEVLKGRLSKGGLITILLSVSISCSLLAATYNRNRIWSSRLAMWQDVVKKSPHNARGWNNLGNCYLLKGNYKDALRAYLTSLDLAVANIELYYNMGLTLENLGMRDIAKDFFIIFVKNGPEGYKKEIGELTLRYDIRADTPMPDIRRMKQRAKEAISGTG